VIERVILIAPPVSRSDFGILRTTTVPKLVIQGTADEICDPAVLEPEFARWAEPKQLVRIEGAGHFFDRHLGALAATLEHELGPQLEERK
jgi:hypothetical protein